MGSVLFFLKYCHDGLLTLQMGCSKAEQQLELWAVHLARCTSYHI